MRALVFVVLTGCVGAIEGSGPTGQNPDGGTGGQHDAKVLPPDAPTVACRNPVATVGNGHHRPGEDCQSGCHNHGFTLSGTLMSSGTATTPVVGATILVKDAAGTMFEMVSQQNGNFYTGNAMQFPVEVVATSCPNTRGMVAKVTAGDGGCNKDGCHTPTATGYVHLP